MSDYQSVNGQRIVSGRITFPRYGAFAGDLALAGTGAIPSTPLGLEIKIGSLELKATTFREAEFAGSRKGRIVAGANGWRTVLPPRGYTLAAGVMLSVVLQDAAREAKETIVVNADRVLGPSYARREGPASRVLRRFLDGKWWIDTNGVTQTGARSSAPIRSAFTVESFDPATGRFVIATEAYGDWMPGRTFSGPTVPTVRTISSASLIIGAQGKTRVEVMTGTTEEERLQDSIRQIIRDELAALQPTQLVAYNVKAYAAGPPATVDLEIADKRSGWPSLLRIPMQPGIMGEIVQPALEKAAVVAFLNGDPTLPKVVSVAGKPVNIELDVETLIKLGGGAQFVALANKVDAIVDAIVNTVIVPMDGGAAIKLAVTAAKTANGGSVAASKVKAT